MRQVILCIDYIDREEIHSFSNHTQDVVAATSISLLSGWPDSKKAAMAGTYNDVFQHIGRYSTDVLHKTLTW